MDEALHLTAAAAREEIRAGSLRGAAFLDRLLAVPFIDRDAWVDALFGLEEIPDDAKDLPREAVPYLPCGVDEIVTMVRELPLKPEDQFVDLGSGLGRVVMLAHLISGARSSGLELQAHLVASARSQGEALNLRDVSFRVAEVTSEDLDGSVFFLYAPFSGEMLRRALDRLEAVARRRRIVLCAVGLELNDVSCLTARATSNVSLTFYESK